MTRECLTTDEFIHLFLAALVLRGKTHIWIRGAHADAERQRMHALHAHLAHACEEARDVRGGDESKFRFLVRVRNLAAPSPIGSFDELRHAIAQKMSSIVDINLPFCDYYRIRLSRASASCLLEQADAHMRRLAEDAADVYVGLVKSAAHSPVS